MYMYMWKYVKMYIYIYVYIYICRMQYVYIFMLNALTHNVERYYVSNFNKLSDVMNKINKSWKN